MAEEPQRSVTAEAAEAKELQRSVIAEKLRQKAAAEATEAEELKRMAIAEGPQRKDHSEGLWLKNCRERL